MFCIWLTTPVKATCEWDIQWINTIHGNEVLNCHMYFGNALFPTYLIKIKNGSIIRKEFILTSNPFYTQNTF